MRCWIGIPLLCAVACGSTSGGAVGSGSATGSVAGSGLTVHDAVFAVSSENQLVIIASDRTDLCRLLASTTPPTGETTALVLALAQLGLVNGGGLLESVPPTAGDYGMLSHTPMLAGRYFFGGFGVGTGCSVSVPGTLTDGMVHVAQVGSSSGTATQATFQLQFGADTLGGEVNAAYCAAVLQPGAGCHIGASRSAPLR
jgi:hypothetical protein